MKNRISKVIGTTALVGLFLSASGRDVADQSEFPQVSVQPTDRDVPLGGSTVLTVESINGDSYQWLRNGVVIDGQTNSTLNLENVGTNDVGYYSCAVIKGSEVVPTRSAALNAYTLTGDQITVFGLPVLGSGNQGSCPGAYAGYVNFIKTVSQGWGWAPSTNTTVHTASDGNRTGTKIVYVGKFGDSGCNQTTVTVPDPTYSPKYRFSIYFTNNVPTNSYAITLTGFNP
jgi:hypothetical protein